MGPLFIFVVVILIVLIMPSIFVWGFKTGEAIERAKWKPKTDWKREEAVTYK